MPERIRFGASFHLDDPIHRKAWEILSKCALHQRTNTLCRMICGYQEQKELLDSISQLLTNQHHATGSEGAPDKAENVDDDVLDFILSLQKGDVTI